MKKLIIVGCILSPCLLGSGEYTRHVLAGEIREVRSGVVRSVKRTSLSQRIESFALKHGAKPDEAPLLAEIISRKEHPKLLAAIAAKESNFNLKARGAAGERGAYQIMPMHGNPGKTWESQTDAADRILQDLLTDSRGKVWPAVRSYNGSGEKATQYANSIISLSRKI